MSVANLLTLIDSGFESGVGDWLPGGFTQIATSTAQAHPGIYGGTHSLALTCLSNGPSSAVLNVLFPVLPGVIINPGAWFFSPGTNGGQLAQFNLTWYANDKATIVGNSPSTSTFLTANTWQLAQSVGIQAPSNAFWVQLQVFVHNNSAGNINYIDDVFLSWGNYATNMCPNPSFETDLTGWGQVQHDETLTQVTTYSQTTFAPSTSQSSQPNFLRIFAGNNALQVSTPGLVRGEGIIGPSTWLPAVSTTPQPLVPPVFVRQNTGGTPSATLIGNVNQAVPAGATVLVATGGSSASTTMSIADSKGNTYTQQVSDVSRGSTTVTVWSSVITTPLTITDTYTVTASGSQTMYITGLIIPNAVKIDQAVITDNSGSTQSVTTGTLSHTVEYVIGFGHNGSTPPTWSAPMTQITQDAPPVAGAGYFTTSYAAVNATTPVTVATTTGGSVGFTMAAVTVAVTSTSGGPAGGSMSCNLFGETGTVAVQAVDQITGTIIGQTVVTLAGGSNWYNATITGLTFVTGHTYYMQIVTYGPAQSLTFMVDGVMYQPEPPTIYVDGDTLQGIWTGTAEESASFQPYQFGIVSTCKFTIYGAANIIPPGTVALSINALEFFITFGPSLPSGGNVVPTILSPSAAMTDFGIWQGGALGTDLDPAMAYSTWNNTGALSGAVAYTRPYMAVCPPLDQFTSSGGYNWKRAAYMALGWQWLSVTNGTSQVLTAVQSELLPINGVNQITPRGYQFARQLQTIVRPDRLNYVTNPSFQISTANWSQIGSGQTLAVSSNVPSPPGLLFALDTNSMAVTATSGSSGGAQITINNLIPGRTYMASCWVQPDGTSMGDITVTCGSASGTLSSSTGTGYGSLPFGSGPYGGVYLTTNPLPATWAQVFFSFMATADSHALQLAPVNVASPNYPYTWYVDAVLIEDGDILNPYFDGNFGPDALWLDGGTAGLCQSFYYNQLEFARHIIVDSLAANTPLGISFAQPKYATMPTQ